mmetsp:Transcript_84195/g.225134  ORF Transcript_84195/g.225134 Transcript_84195/m.225134 type:complete len:83 (+) Transcript_84195:455-703(+)
MTGPTASGGFRRLEAHWKPLHATVLPNLRGASSCFPTSGTESSGARCTAFGAGESGSQWVSISLGTQRMQCRPRGTHYDAAV